MKDMKFMKGKPKFKQKQFLTTPWESYVTDQFVKGGLGDHAVDWIIRKKRMENSSLGGF